MRPIGDWSMSMSLSMLFDAFDAVVIADGVRSFAALFVRWRPPLRQRLRAFHQDVVDERDFCRSR